MLNEAIYIALKNELEASRQRHESAKRRVSEISARTPETTRYIAGVPEPDGSQIFRKALAEENEARHLHIQALTRLSDYLLTGKVPEHLKR